MGVTLSHLEHLPTLIQLDLLAVFYFVTKLPYNAHPDVMTHMTHLEHLPTLIRLDLLAVFYFVTKLPYNAHPDVMTQSSGGAPSTYLYNCRRIPGLPS